MNRKELKEIRRRVRPEHNNIQHLYGCYVNSQKEIIARIDESVGILPMEEQEKYISLLKKTLSGSLGKNLMDISFSTMQVADSDEHRLLSALLRTSLRDDVIREQFYSCVSEALDMGESNYLILIACDAYDVPRYGRDGERDSESRDVFNYIICCVCPVKSSKPVLSFSAEESRFHNLNLSQVVTSPEIGFMFPAFDDRSANIYNALFYSRDTKGIHKDFIDAVFKTRVPLSALQQRSAFSAAVKETLAENCSLETVQNVQSLLRDRIELHKESGEPDELVMSYEEVEEILEDAGMDSSRKDAFLSNCREQFGQDLSLSPKNLMDEKNLKIETETVSIKASPGISSLIRTETIDGRKYILIPADGGVEVNGIAVEL